jgi:hypothetical protein
MGSLSQGFAGIIGAVVFWGRVVVVRDGNSRCINGVKAQYARPLALLNDKSSSWYHLKLAEGRYGIPIMEEDLMMKVLPEFGDMNWWKDDTPKENASG